MHTCILATVLYVLTALKGVIAKHGASTWALLYEDSLSLSANLRCNVRKTCYEWR